jgi:N-acetylglucosamine malate deacetylase 1
LTDGFSGCVSISNGVRVRPACDPEESDIPGPDLILEKLALRRPSRILVLGTSDRPLASRFGELGHEVEQAASIPGPHSRFDVVIALRLLDEETWGRWALQRVHRLLVDDGHLVVSAANTLEAGALVDPRYVGRKLWKQIVRLAPGRVSGPPESHRTFTRSQLAQMLEELGYEIASRWGESPAGKPVPEMFAARHWVVCRRLPSLYGLSSRRPYPDAVRHRLRFERSHRNFIRLRQRWCRRHSIEVIAEPAELRLEGLADRAVLVLSPHPDDELIGCGGTLLRTIAAGARVVVIQATDGSASASLAGSPEHERRRKRLHEAEAVSKTAGFETIFWAENNRCFEVRSEHVAKVRALLDRLRPELVFVPFLADAHVDHRTLDRVLAEALREEDACTILQYEVWGLVPANVCCDVTEEMSRVEDLLLLYETAMMVDDYVHFCASRNYYHAARCPAARGYAEAFHSTSAARFRALAEAGHVNAASGNHSVPR